MIDCPYCDKPAILVTGKEIYPHREDLYDKKFWSCEPCDAYVGCHKNSRKHAPLGRLASKNLRQLKSIAHSHFDPIWRGREMSRSNAYQYLADRLGIDKRDCHIGMFDENTCRKVIQIMKQDLEIRQISRRH